MNVMNEEWRGLHAKCQALESKFLELQDMARNLVQNGHDATHIAFEMAILHRELRPLAKQRSALCTHRIKCDPGRYGLFPRGDRLKDELRSDGI